LIKIELMSASRIFFYFCLALIGGIFLDSIKPVSLPLILCLLILGIFLISVFLKYKKLVVLGLCLFGLVFGIFRHQLVESKIIHPQEGDITFEGLVVKEPDVRANNTKLTVESENVYGRVLVTTERYPEYQYGDRLKISGKLKIPQAFGGFNYQGYLAKEGIYSVIYFPEIELIAKNQGNFLYAKILGFKEKLRESIYQNLSPPQSSILGAIILGDKRRLSEDLKQKLNLTGVRHITAISGMHITILSVILMSVLILLGLARGQAFYFTLFFISLFILMTGLQPSAIRAGIMGSLFLLAQKLGRLNLSIRALVLAAALMLLINPLLLKEDVGFQLSFLAMLGIIYLFPIFQNWLSVLPKKLKNLSALTFSAYLFTLPILIYNFGYFSLVAIFSNILILPILPLIMILGFVFGILGMVHPFLGWIFSWPTWLALTYLFKIVEWFSQIPLAALRVENLSWIFVLVAYFILGLLIYKFNQKQKYLNFQNI